MRRRSFRVERRHSSRQEAIALQLLDHFFVRDCGLVPSLGDRGKIRQILQEPLVLLDWQQHRRLFPSVISDILSAHVRSIPCLAHTVEVCSPGRRAPMPVTPGQGGPKTEKFMARGKTGLAMMGELKGFISPDSRCRLSLSSCACRAVPAHTSASQASRSPHRDRGHSPQRVIRARAVPPACRSHRPFR